MDEHGTGSLAERVKRLEREVEELRIGSRRAECDSAPGSGAESRRVRSSCATTSPIPETATVTGSERTFRERSWDLSMPFGVGGLRRGEWWLNKIGIGLLLFGVAFFVLALR